MTRWRPLRRSTNSASRLAEYDRFVRFRDEAVFSWRGPCIAACEPYAARARNLPLASV
jgi:hypothetical protein